VAADLPGSRSSRSSRSSSNTNSFSNSNVDAEDVKEIFQSTRHGRASEVTQLLEKGVPVNVKDKFGNTILAVACQNGLKKLAKIALRRGADINSKNYKGNTPLHFCYTYGYGDTLGTYLISKGADPDIRNHSGHVCYDGLGGTGKK
jgi:ankyrin repeat protein